MKRIFNFLLILCGCWQIVPAYADVLITPNILFKKEQDTKKEKVSIWSDELLDPFA